jgi:hypothetical protein
VPDDAAWADHVVVPDDARELAPDLEAYRRELRAARRARRWAWLTGSRTWQRWSFPLGMVAGALLLATLVFVLLAFESAPGRPDRLTSAPLATPTGGLLPDSLLSSAPAGGSAGTVESALALRPALVALLPISCDCTGVVTELAKQASGIGVSLVVIAPGARDAEVSALRGQVHGIKTWYDGTGALATAFRAHGVTVLVVDPDGVVSFVQRDTTAESARTLPVQSLLVLPPYVSDAG